MARPSGWPRHWLGIDCEALGRGAEAGCCFPRSPPGLSPAYGHPFDPLFLVLLQDVEGCRSQVLADWCLPVRTATSNVSPLLPSRLTLPSTCYLIPRIPHCWHSHDSHWLPLCDRGHHPVSFSQSLSPTQTPWFAHSPQCFWPSLFSRKVPSPFPGKTPALCLMTPPRLPASHSRLPCNPQPVSFSFHSPDSSTPWNLDLSVKANVNF